MTERLCPQCAARLAPSATWCPLCGADLDAPDSQYDPEGLTVVAEDESELSAASPATEPAPAYAEPAPTIIEEPEPLPAIVNLHITDSEDGARVVEIQISEGAAYTVGRDGRVTDYVPTDPRASRRHFSLGLAPEGLYLADLGSSNGTFLNGTKVSESVWLKDGDAIEYGRSKAIVRIVQMPEKS